MFRDQVLALLTSAGVNVTGDICSLQFTPGSIYIRAFTPGVDEALNVFSAVASTGGTLTVNVANTVATGHVLGMIRFVISYPSL